MATLLIGADVCPIGVNKPFFENGDAHGLLNDLLPEFQAADLVIANLECPLTGRSTPILKTGPSFGEPPACINGIKAAGVHVLALANNHILDHGPAGLGNTLEVCAKAGIATVGAGQTLAEAQRMLIREAAGVRVGLLAMAEHEFSIAGTDRAGANPLDVTTFVRSVNAHRALFDFLVVLVHGGDEFQVPTPRLQDTCRFMVEMGAGAVIVQHPHVLGGWEPYKGGHIVYGQGALLMDEKIYRGRPSFHEGFLVKLEVARNGASTLETLPFVQSAPAPGTRRLTGGQEAEFQARMDARNKLIQDPAFVEAEWLKFCEGRKHDYLSGLLGHNRILSKLNSRGLLSRLLYSRRVLLGVRNTVVCETHREAIETIFTHNLL